MPEMKLACPTVVLSAFGQQADVISTPGTVTTPCFCIVFKNTVSQEISVDVSSSVCRTSALGQNLTLKHTRPNSDTNNKSGLEVSAKIYNFEPANRLVSQLRRAISLKDTRP